MNSDKYDELRQILAERDQRIRTLEQNITLLKLREADLEKELLRLNALPPRASARRIIITLE